ncbi:hypothetical protein LCI18_001408 [Fusarium solani-melongenae]|uniref:Uncharacterized protein n=1 Tax=Fusarium solani subsp. cucurbitae TaxID=2747967 RepID=A0ACD3YNG6_FUSSC|nr:hypothetical protein LCI18_001408 [Fusarium solani-melongenae]
MDDPTPLRTGRLLGKVAVVTGASSGFGRAIAFRFSREGAKVVCADIKEDPDTGGSRDADKGFRTDKYITSKGGQAIFVKVDVSDSAQVDQMIARAVAEYGQLHIMVNNAGICPEAQAPNAGKLLYDLDDEVFDKTMRVNSRSVFLGCKYANRQFLKQDVLSSGDRGWIVNIGSTASLTADVGIGAYNTSKGAVLQTTKSVAVEMAPHKIHCNIVCPGDVITSCFEPHLYDESAVANSLAKYPWGRFGSVSEIAAAVCFLASPDAGFITGAVLSVDGGFVAQ